MKSFDAYEKTRTILFPFSVVIRCASLIARTKERVQIVKIGRIPKPPFLLISTHASFMDFYVSIKANEPYQPYWVSTVEEFIDKEFIFRELGIIPKRKFTNDPRSAQMMLEVLKDRKKILIMYPEARYSFVGKEERLDNGIAKLAKSAGVPIVFMNCHGHYLRDPQWGDHVVRKVNPLISEMKCIVSKKHVKEWPVEAIQDIIVQSFKYDDEQYQQDKGIKINYPNRAVGIERILYKCPHCGREFEMSSNGSTFRCDHCGKEYNLKENGLIECTNGESKFTRASDWYYWEKECVRDEVNNGTYFFEDDIRLERLVDTVKGFVPMDGKYHLRHTIDKGFEITGDNGFLYNRSPIANYAVHLEYNYRGRGGCLDFATNKESYFAFPLSKQKALTKIHFAVEIIFDLANSKLHKE